MNPFCSSSTSMPFWAEMMVVANSHQWNAQFHRDTTLIIPWSRAKLTILPKSIRKWTHKNKNNLRPDITWKLHLKRGNSSLLSAEEKYKYTIKLQVWNLFNELQRRRKTVTTHVKKYTPIHTCWYTQSAAYTSLAFGATRSGWWMNAKPSRFSVEDVSRSFLELWRLKH